MKLLELFAGTGALGLAVENTLGAATAYVAEWDDAPSKVLAHRFPAAPNLRDVTTAQWDSLGAVDVISGGSPCQDISGAGRRAGMIRGNRSGLWESYREAIAVLRPRFVVWENVRGALTSKASSLTDPDGKGGVLRALGRVLGDLATLGYDAEWCLVRASDVGACHQRARVFLLAWDRWTVPALPVDADRYAVWDVDGDRFLAPGVGLFAATGDPYNDKMPTDGAMRHGNLYPRNASVTSAQPFKLLPTPVVSDSFGGSNETANRKPGAKFASGRTLSDFAYLYPDAGALKLLPTPGANLGSNGGPQHPDKRRAGNHSVSIEDVAAFKFAEAGAIKLLPTPVAQPSGTSPESFLARKGDGRAVVTDLAIIAEHNLFATGGRLNPEGLTGWGEYLPAVLRHAAVFDQDVPAPTEPAAREGGRPRLAAPFVEWMMCLNPGWVTDPGLGIKRADLLKMLGNGVVKPQAEHGINTMLANAGITTNTRAQAA